MDSIKQKEHWKLQDLTNQRFGRLVAIRVLPKASGESCRKWECVCDCGNTSFVRPGQLVSGKTQSCGCLHREQLSKRNTSHGKAFSRAYRSWNDMIQRCTNPRNKHYLRYGARGITVCDRWMKFESFYEDMGDRPEGMTIDRIENDLGYFPGNCRWATPAQQMRNYSRTHLIEFQGRTQCLTDWAAETGIARHVITGRLLRQGWSIEKALTTPVRPMKSKSQWQQSY